MVIICRNLYNFALVGRLLLTWFPSRPPALERPLRSDIEFFHFLSESCSCSTICDPYLNLFRGIIPPLGGIDFSPILAFVVLNVRSYLSRIDSETVSVGCSSGVHKCSSSYTSRTAQKKTVRFRKLMKKIHVANIRWRTRSSSF